MKVNQRSCRQNSLPGIRTLSFPKNPSIQARPVIENQMEKKMDNEMDNWSHKGAR